MAGHREHKKERTRRNILANAISFFERDGVRGARSADIATASGVCAATLTNYFATRSDLAEAWVRGELIAHLDRELGVSGAGGLRASLRRVGQALVEHASDRPAARLDAWQHTPRVASARYACPRLVERVAEDQARDRLRRDLEPEVLAGLMVETLEAGLIETLRRQTAGEAPFPLGARLDLILDGARKRNERVPAPALAARSRGSRPLPTRASTPGIEPGSGAEPGSEARPSPGAGST